MTGSQTTVAAAVIAQLAAGGVRRIYGVVGDAVFPLADALSKQDSIQFVGTTQETNAAFMAAYEAKLTGGLAVCLATSGPGATNLATGLADADRDGASVLAITGEVASQQIGTKAKQYLHQQGFFAPISSGSELALGPSAAMQALVTAMVQAIAQRRVTHLSIPKDVQSQAVTWKSFPIGTWQSAAAPPCLTVGDLQEAWRLLGEAKRPVMLLGLSDPATVAASMRLAARWGAAVVVGQQAKGSVPFTAQGVIGGIGEAHVPTMVGEADLLLVVGDASYEFPHLPQGVPAVVINRSPLFLPHNPIVAEFLGEPDQILADLRPRLGTQSVDPAWQDAIRATKHDLEEQAARVLQDSSSEGVNPYRLALALSAALDEDAVIAIDVGAFAHWFDLGFRAKSQRILTSNRWRGMGMALPAAISAGLVNPQRQCVALAGDGAFLISMAELVTAVRFQIPMLVVVVNNGCYDLERQKMIAEGLVPFATDLVLPDLPAFARSCGAIGMQVREASELEPVLRRACQEAADSKKPAVVNVTVTTPQLPHI